MGVRFEVDAVSFEVDAVGVAAATPLGGGGVEIALPGVDPLVGGGGVGTVEYFGGSINLGVAKTLVGIVFGFTGVAVVWKIKLRICYFHRKGATKCSDFFAHESLGNTKKEGQMKSSRLQSRFTQFHRKGKRRGKEAAK